GAVHRNSSILRLAPLPVMAMRLKSGPASRLSSAESGGNRVCRRTKPRARGHDGRTRSTTRRGRGRGRNGLVGAGGALAAHGPAQLAAAVTDGRPEGLDPDGRDAAGVLDRAQPFADRRIAVVADGAGRVRLRQLAVRGDGGA